MSSFRHMFGKTLFGRFLSSSRQNNATQRCKKSTLTEPVASKFQLKTLSQYEKTSFKNLLPELVKDLTHNGEHQGMPIVTEHLSKSIMYNCTDGKMTRGYTVALSLKLLSEDDKLCEDKIKMNDAYVLGWCIEFLQAYFLVSDDMMDASTTRRGKKCWYLEDNLGMLAINDAILLESSVYTLLDKYFRNAPYYVNLLDAFLHTTRHTAMGQQLDLMSPKCKLQDFDMNLYSQIVQYKTAYYSFYLPVQLGMILAGVQNPELYRQARSILLAMGHLFQVQDDFIDCFGDPSITGKIGTDIQDRKCSWLIVQALHNADENQRQILQECYGLDNSEAIAKVKEVYDSLQMQKVYRNYEDEAYEDIVQKIKVLSERSSLNPDIFFSFLTKIYKRES